MSIIAYVGLPGSGKSYDVVANQILPALEQGRRVVTNIPLNRDAIRELHTGGEIVDLPLDKIAMQPEVLDEYATPGSVVIIDEVWRLWPSGLKTDKIPQVFKSFLAEHRHKVDSKGNAMQIVLVTQDLAQISAFARQLVEQTFHHTKLTHVGSRGTYRIDMFHGAITGAVPPVSNRLRESFGKYSPKIFKLYKSHTMSDSKKSGGNEVAMDKRGNILRRPIIWLGLGFAVVGGFFGVSHLAGIASGTSGLGSSAARSGPTPAAGPPNSSLRKGSYSPGSRSAAMPRPYRVAGHVTWPGEGRSAGPGSFAFVTNDVDTFRVPFTDCFADSFRGVSCVFEGQLVREAGAPLELRVTSSPAEPEEPTESPANDVSASVSEAVSMVGGSAKQP